MTTALRKPPFAILFATTAFLLFGAGAGGCQQGLNDRCQIDSDCMTGLYCELAGMTRATGGTCRVSGSTTGADLSVPTADLSVPQGVDQAAPGDLASPPDGGDGGLDK